jgi:hypothetical protein
MGELGPGIPGGPPPRMQGPPNMQGPPRFPPPGNVALKLWFYRLLSHF